MTHHSLKIASAHIFSAPLDEVPDSELSASEISLAKKAPSEQRRLELRAGRAMARQALLALSPNSPVTILADSKGRPQVIGQSAHLSIAHTRHQVFAAAAPNPLGIDAESFERTGQIARVVASLKQRGRAASLRWDSDLARQVAEASSLAVKEGNPGLFHPAASWNDATLLWTAWEALGKLAGDGVLSGVMLQEIRIEGVEAETQQLVGSSVGRRLWWWGESGHLCCLAMANAG